MRETLKTHWPEYLMEAAELVGILLAAEAYLNLKHQVACAKY